MIRYIGIICFLFFYSLLSSQSSYFNSLEVSQNTNNYLFKSSESLLFISSSDGLNVYNGLQNNIYRPSTHNMFGFNIQSPFFEDTTGKIWFTTYEALNYFDPAMDDLGYFFMISPNGEKLKDNYRAFALDSNKLFLKAGKEILVFDIYKHLIIQRYNIDLSHIFNISLIKNELDYLIFTCSDDNYKLFKITGDSYTLVDKGKRDIQAVCNDNNYILTGSSNGRISIYDPVKMHFVDSFNIVPLSINAISKLAVDKLIISCNSDEIYIYNLISRQISKTIPVVSSITSKPAERILVPYVDTDSTLWIGAEGQGVYFCNLKKQKLEHELRSDPCSNQYSITKILPYSDSSLIVLTRGYGILLLNINGSIKQRWNELPTGQVNFSARNGTWINKELLLFSSRRNLYLLNMKSSYIDLINNEFIESDIFYEQIDKIGNGKIITSCDSLLLNEIVIEENKFRLFPYGNFEKQATTTTYFKEDKEGNLYVSNDEKTVLVLKPTKDGTNHFFDYSLPIPGGVWGISDDLQHNSLYLSNSHGLYYINKESHLFRQIRDKDLLLLQTIYSVLSDNDGNLWLGTNKGLMKYYPVTNEVKVFSQMDGIQALEYNSHAYLKTEDGHMLFGGINGLNYFHPSEVTFSQKPAPVYFDEIRINDEPDATYRVPQYVSHIDLPYVKNTFSIDFHAIDYSDPQATRVKYKLDGVDNEYIESNNAHGFARYANLRPGKYTFSILGVNSDGIVNTNPRELAVTIHPPYWQTWWFISLLSLSVSLFIYWLFRSYFKRQLEKKNQLLREQTLIIEKQQAVEHERTRIASEMHDDLGSGLTTIRYLSDKALTHAKDSEEAVQIQRIADHSNALVRNMSEIIWAMNSRFDNTQNLTGYLRRYASEFLDEHQLPLKFEIDDDNTEVDIGGEKRRNIFLVFKELLHNSVKYSKAESIQVRITTGDQFIITITEVKGIGFDPEAFIDKGNGLFNCRKRMKSIDGSITFEKTETAMNFIISAPLNIEKIGKD